MLTYAISAVVAPMPQSRKPPEAGQADFALASRRILSGRRTDQISFAPLRPDDRETLAQSFKLSDAQELIARLHGFECWQALKTGFSAMTDQLEQTTTKAVIAGVEPQLFVADIKASCDFFVERLGFTIVFTYGEPPYYAQVKRDAARLNLRCVDRPAIDPQFRDRAELLSATLVVATPEEIKQLFLEFQKSEVSFVQTLTRKPWSARDFIIKDIDGNLLLFAGPAE